ncbi:NUDIX domain-containing protein [Amaricoccus sp.]|uniref:NUDIX domain-containing protein n=1 Tax=Amaricoccus sp. TaxID=1872485 RepID=UPI001B5957AD|nr:NUDIX domain-containing protein [Amaricoccus sp.]MBP7241500.1 NUDIX domain-containing protein [Amaricoccus sp.]
MSLRVNLRARVRLAVRAVVMNRGRVLVVNAYPGDESDLWCAPGGGAEPGLSLPENLAREVMEETGIAVTPGRLLAVSEFHDPPSGFHQVDLFYAATLDGPADHRLADPDGVVNRLRWVDAAELATLRYKPACLADLAFGPEGPVLYDPLEPIVR